MIIVKVTILLWSPSAHRSGTEDFDDVDVENWDYNANDNPEELNSIALSFIFSDKVRVNTIQENTSIRGREHNPGGLYQPVQFICCYAVALVWSWIHRVLLAFAGLD